MYKRKCDATGEQIFSYINPKAPYRVYEREYWWSDAWDPMDYGKEIDFSRPFLAQLNDLMHEVPWASRSVLNNVNSDYCMNSSDQKNCYLTFHGNNNESCFYGVGVSHSRDSFDNTYLDKCEFCHQCLFCMSCYQTFYSIDCENSQDLIFCKDCVNCHDCIGCAGLRNKQYHIFNRPHSKEDYKKEAEVLNLASYKDFLALKERAVKVWLTVPVKYAHEAHNLRVSGEYIYNAKNVFKSYVMMDSEECKYCQNIFQQPGTKDSYDYSFFGRGSELIYESCSVGIKVANVKFSAFIYPDSQRISYSVLCHSSRDLFGCIGLQKKQYCILNKQYTKEEYELLVPRVITHMNEMPYIDKKGREYRYGEYFPPEFCPFGYNETVAQEYFPKTKEEAATGGWPWTEPEMKEYEPTLSWKDMPEDISRVNEDITNETILCELWEKEGAERAMEHNCSKAFKIVPEEFKFYKRFNLPLPRKCFNCRHYERGKLRNPLKLWKRTCQCVGIKSENGIYQNTTKHQHGVEKCPNEFETSYAPERKEIVYCEQCYNSEVV